METRDWAMMQGDVLDMLRFLPDKLVQCVVTSPPYYGLRDYGVEGQLGLEKRPDCAGWATGAPCGECYVCRTTAVFREVKRVLRDDGVLWLNIGDSYAGNGKAGRADGGRLIGRSDGTSGSVSGKTERKDIHRGGEHLKDKDLMMIPARLAMSMQADGWYLRSEIIWSKKAPMPESVQDRPTRAHETIWLLTKSARYYYDADAVREPYNEGSLGRYASPLMGTAPTSRQPGGDVGRREREKGLRDPNPAGRGLRDVWHLGPSPYPEAHFATFPPAIPERCIKAGTSEAGCCSECGRPWERDIARQSNYEKREAAHTPNNSTTKVDSTGWKPPTITDNGWQPGCKHDAPPAQCIVLDPFAGAGTTLLVANRLNRRAIGIELNPEYAEMAAQRIANDAPMFSAPPVVDSAPKQLSLIA